MVSLLFALVSVQFVSLFFIAMYLGFTMDNLDVAVKTIRSLEDSLSALSMAHDETVQATRATDDRFVELSEKIENIDEDVLDGTICCQFIENEARKTLEESDTSNINELKDSIENLESKIEIIASSFRCLGSDLE